jgi:hypothetical protein
MAALCTTSEQGMIMPLLKEKALLRDASLTFYIL